MVLPQPIQVDVRSPHVVGIHEGWTADGLIFCFTTAALSRMLVSATGSWRMRRSESGWQEHGPNHPDWVELEKSRIGGLVGYRLDRRWSWQSISLVAIPTPERPVALAPPLAPVRAVERRAPHPDDAVTPVLPAPRSISAKRRRTPA